LQLAITIILELLAFLLLFSFFFTTFAEIFIFMKKIYYFSALLFCLSGCVSKSSIARIPNDFYTKWLKDNQLTNPCDLDTPVLPPGSEKAFINFLKSNIKYPQKAQNDFIQGAVNLVFIVEEDGSVSNAKVQKCYSFRCEDGYFAKEVLRVVELMPKLEVGTINGEPKRVGMQVEIFFSLGDFGPQVIPLLSCHLTDERLGKECTPPQFPGGEDGLLLFLRDNITYSELAHQRGIQANVYVLFEIEKDGSISDIQIIRGIGGGFDFEAFRVISAMPKWEPAAIDDEPVRTRFRMPVEFRLESLTFHKPMGSRF
jgi:TonB family protein